MDEQTGIILWAAGLVSAAIFGWLAKITHMLTGLSDRYVPRSQIDDRFLRVERQILGEKQDRREDMREIKGQLDTIIQKLDSKADK